MVKLRYWTCICLEERMKTETPTLPFMIADDTTAEIQARHRNAGLDDYHSINPFCTEVCITDDSLAYHNIHL